MMYMKSKVCGHVSFPGALSPSASCAASDETNEEALRGSLTATSDLSCDADGRRPVSESNLQASM